LELGRTYSIPRYFIRDRNPVIIKVLARQTISVPAGRFRTIVVQPVFRSRGLFGRGGQALIWITDDAERIPVRIRVNPTSDALKLRAGMSVTVSIDTGHRRTLAEVLF